MLSVAVAITIAASGSAQPQRAVKPPTMPREEKGGNADVLLPTGIALLPLAPLGLGIGGFLLSSDRLGVCEITKGPRRCTPDTVEERALGAGLVSAGVAAGVAGLTLVTLGAWRSGPSRPKSGPQLMLGSWLLGVGLATTAMGAGTLIAFDAEQRDVPLDTRDGILVLTVHGALMIATGASITGYALEVEEAKQISYSSGNRAPLYAGLGLATAATTTAAVNALYLAYYDFNDLYDQSFSAPFLTIVSLASTAGLLGSGLVLWIRASRDVEATTVSVRGGPTGLALQAILP